MANARRERRRWAGTNRKRPKARNVPLTPRNRSRDRPIELVVRALELTVSIEATGVAPVMLTDAGAIAQVIGSTAPAGELVTAHARLTVPVYPPSGVTLIVAELPLEEPAWRLRGPLLLSERFGITPAVTVTCVVVEDLISPVAASVPE